MRKIFKKGFVSLALMLIFGTYVLGGGSSLSHTPVQRPAVYAIALDSPIVSVTYPSGHTGHVFEIFNGASNIIENVIIKNNNPAQSAAVAAIQAGDFLVLFLNPDGSYEVSEIKSNGINLDAAVNNGYAAEAISSDISGPAIRLDRSNNRVGLNPGIGTVISGGEADIVDGEISAIIDQDTVIIVQITDELTGEVQTARYNIDNLPDELLERSSRAAFIVREDHNDEGEDEDDRIAVEALNLNKYELIIAAGNSERLAASVIPSNAANRSVAWSSSDASVATVDINGRVRAVSVGTAVITARAGNIAAECAVTVNLGIDYSADDIILTGRSFSFKSGKEIPADAVLAEKTEETAAEINLTRETLDITGYRIQAYSIDGGFTWKAGSLNTAGFVKLLNKDTELWLCFKDYNSNAKKPQGSGDEHNILAFPKINKRAPARKLVVNYAVGADLTGATAGGWGLTERGSTDMIREGIEVALAGSSGKTVDANGWGKFYDGRGVPVRELTGTKAVKTRYFIRIAPAENDGVYTAASKPRRINVTSEQKPPKYKVNKGVIKLKAGTYVSMNGQVSLHSVKSEITPEGTVEIWQAATAKKAASAKQVLTR